ncbi:MAG: hypothetical protein ABI275_10585 [Terrimesophilobacter sp.]
MSFRDDVEALRLLPSFETAEQELPRVPSEEGSRVVFERELRELWGSAEDYLREQVGSSGEKEVKSHVRKSLLDSNLSVFVFRRPVDLAAPGNASREIVADVPYDKVQGINVLDCFALCRPGEVRVLARPAKPKKEEVQSSQEVASFVAMMRSLLPDISKTVQDGLRSGKSIKLINVEIRQLQLGKLRKTIRRSYSRVSYTDIPRFLTPDDLSSYYTVFNAPQGEPAIALHCTAQGPIRVYAKSPKGWELRGSLRELVAEAVARLVDEAGVSLSG